MDEYTESTESSSDDYPEEKSIRVMFYKYIELLNKHSASFDNLIIRSKCLKTFLSYSLWNSSNIYTLLKKKSYNTVPDEIVSYIKKDDKTLNLLVLDDLISKSTNKKMLLNLIIKSEERCIPRMPDLYLFKDLDTQEIHIKSLMIYLLKCSDIKHANSDFLPRDDFCDYILEYFLFSGRYILKQLALAYPEHTGLNSLITILNKYEARLYNKYPRYKPCTQRSKCRYYLIKTYILCCGYFYAILHSIVSDNTKLSFTQLPI